MSTLVWSPAVRQARKALALLAVLALVAQLFIPILDFSSVARAQDAATPVVSDSSAAAATETPVPAPTEAPAAVPTETQAPPVPTETLAPAPTDTVAPVVIDTPTQEPASTATTSPTAATAPTKVVTGPPTIKSDLADYPPGGRVTLTGTNWQPGETVHIYVNDDLGSSWNRNVDVTADADGNLTDAFNLPDWFVAVYTVSANGLLSGTTTTRFTDAIEVQSATLNSTSSVVVSAGSSITASVTLKSSSNDSWHSTSWRIGTASSLGTAVCSNHGNFDGNGNYTATFNITAPTGAGTYNVTFIGYANDLCTLTPVSAAYTLSNAIIVDTVGPDTTITVSPLNPSNGAPSFSFIGSDNVTASANLTFECSMDGATFAACPTPKNYSGVASGSHTFQVRAKDQAGNTDTSPASFTWNVDATAPAAPTNLATTPTSPGSSTTPSVSGKAESSSTIKIYTNATCTSAVAGTGTAASNGGGAFSIQVTVAANSTTTFYATATDAAGNTSDCSTTGVTYQQATNSAPVAAAQSVTTNEDTPKAITLSATDADGNSLAFSIVSQPSSGTLGAIGTASCASGTCTAIVTYTPGANYNGTDSFTFRANDATLGSNTATVSITVSAVNDAPVANGQSVTTAEDAAKATTLTGSDVEGSALTYAVASGPANGTLSGTGASLTYTPNANFSGSDSFTFKVNDGTVDSATATVTINVTAVNDAPVAANDSATVAEDTSVAIAVVANDTDVDNTVAQLSVKAGSISTPANGTVVLNANGTITYTPNADFNGTDTFTYTVCDNGTPSVCSTGTATVSVTVSAVNDAPVAVADTATTAEDAPKTLTQADLKGNDTDVDNTNAQLSVTAVSNPINGTVVRNTDGTVTFTPAANYNGTAGFDYTLSDGSLTATGHVTITVNAVNDAPVAVGDTKSTNEDTALAFPASELPSNDSTGPANESGQTLTVTAVTATTDTHGTVTLVGGTITYTPAADYNGPASFQYTVQDNAGGTDTATALVNVTVTAVNDAPAAAAESVTTAEDTARPITLAATDAEGSTLSYSIVTGPAHGTLTGTAPNLTYTPALNYSGTDSFTFKANDGTVDSNTATVSITVTAVNDAPVANSQSVTTNEDVEKAISLTGSDVDGDALTYTVVAGPSHGTLTNSTYTPNANYNGSDSFTFTTSDGTATSAEATVSITVTAVNDAPAAADDTKSMDEDTALTFLAASLTTNDSTGPDNESGQTLTVTAVTATGDTHGTVMLVGGTITYTPAANYYGPASFQYTVQDSAGGTDTATAYINVTVDAVNDAPVAVDDAADTDEDTATTLAQADLKGNDTDVDNTNAQLSVTDAFGATNGTVVLNGDGTVTFTPAANFNGTAGFDYTVSDGALTDTGHVTITVTAVNDAPVAANGGETVVEDSSSNPINLAASDVDGDPLTYTIVVEPLHGTLSTVDGDKVTYTPNGNHTGPDSFSFKAYDGTIDSNVATVSITVTAVNDAPVAVDDGASTDEDQALVLGQTDLTGNDTDVDSADLVVSAVSGASDGDVTLNVDGTVTFTPASNFNGTSGFDYTVSDGSLSDTGHVTITVTAVNDAPVAANDSTSTNEDTALAFPASDLLGNDSTGPANESGQTLTVTAVTPNIESHGTVVLSDGWITFRPALNYSGVASFQYTVSDGAGTFDTATAYVNVTVAEVNDAPSFTVGTDQSVLEDAGAQSVTDWATAILANDAGQEVDFIVTNDINSLFSVQPAISADGTLTYTLAPNMNGSATVTVRIHDNGGTDRGGIDTSAMQTFTITVSAVNDAPSFATGTNQTVAEDAGAQSVPGWATEISAGPANESAEAVSFTVTNGNNALFSVQPAISADGTLTYTPAANANGVATVTVTVTDDGGSANGGADTSAAQTFTITVDAVNDAPVANAQSVSVIEDTAKAITLSATDVDSAALTYSVVGQPTHGTVVLNADGTFTYTPAADYNGSDSFTFKANDGTVDSNTATVSITVNAVNDAPSFATGANQTVAEDAGAQTVPGWATEISAGPANESTQAVSFTVTNDVNALFLVQPAISPSGTLTYTLAANQNGSATVTVRIHDNGGTANGGADTSAPQTFTITVTSVNDVPSFTKGANQTVAEDASAQSVASWATLISAGPTNESTQTVSFITSNSNNALFSTQPAVSAAGTLTYTLAANQNGSATITVAVKDNGGTTNGGADTSAPQTFTITVNAVNDAPVAVNDTATTAEDVAKTFAQADLTGNDTDVDTANAQLSVSAVSGATNGTVALNGDGTVTFTPAANYNGTAGFDYTLSDGSLTATGRVTVTVTAVNDAPVVSAFFNQAAIGCGIGNATLTVTFTDADASDTHSATIVWGDGTVESIASPTGSPFSKTHTYARAGSYNASVSVSDNQGGTGTDSTNPVSVNYTVVGGGIQSPINQDGTSVFNANSTIPVKIKLIDCNGTVPTNLTLYITITVYSNGVPSATINEPISTSAADTSGVMRYSSDGSYIYNLSAKSLPDPTATYVIKISTGSHTGPVVSKVKIGLKSK